MGFWGVEIEKAKSKADVRSLEFSATRDVNTAVAKLLPISWIRRLVKNSLDYSNYSIDKCIAKIFSPEKDDWTDQAVFAVIGYKKPFIEELRDPTYTIDRSMAKLHSKVGLLLSISEDDQVGMFGIWPEELFQSYKRKPQDMRIAQSLLANKPQFWKDVFIMVPSDYDWDSILRVKKQGL